MNTHQSREWRPCDIVFEFVHIVHSHINMHRFHVTVDRIGRILNEITLSTQQKPDRGTKCTRNFFKNNTTRDII